MRNPGLALCSLLFRRMFGRACGLLLLSLGVALIIWNFSNLDRKATAQGPDVDYSKFLHNSQRHLSIACTSCHERSDNSSTPRFPGHKACTGCHLGQFTTPAISMCMICHTENSG